MNVKRENHQNQTDNLLENLSRVKQLITVEGEKKEKEAQKIITFLKSLKKGDLLEKKPTILRDQDKYISSKVDFSYYKLNLNFLKQSDINLKNISYDIFTSDSCNNMMYVEYYIDKNNSCVIFVKYHFNHIRLYSKNGKTDCLTNAFINTKSEIFYYDKVVGCKLLRRFKIGASLSDARNLIRNKSYKIESLNNRVFKISCGNNPEVFEEKSLSDIHLLISSLTDILVEKYQDTNIPSKSRIHIETKFIGTSSEPVDIQTKVKVNYKYSGIIQITEELLEYEVTLYFLDFPDKKVIANFYLTKSEIAQSLTLTDNLLENIVIESVNEKIQTRFYYKSLYKKNFVEKIELKDQTSSLDPIARTIYDIGSINSRFVNFPKLSDSFKGIYFEYFKIDTEKVCTKFPFGQIGESKFKYDDGTFSQSTIYYAVYDEKVYLIEVYTPYESYTYTNYCTEIFLPVFGIEQISFNIFTPSNVNDVDKFVNGLSSNTLLNGSMQYSNTNLNYRPTAKRMSLVFQGQLFIDIFPDFTIETDAKRGACKVISTDSKTIYKKIIDCITESRVTDADFNFSSHFGFPGYDDEYCKKTQFPLVSNGLTYGYYLDDGIHDLCVNSPFRDNCNYTYATGDNLMNVAFDNEVPYYKTTLHALFHALFYVRSDRAEISPSGYSSLLGKECINFLLSISCEDLFK